MSPQGDLIQLSPSCNGRYVNPKGSSSHPRCQPFLQKLQHWTNRAVNWVNCTSQTPGFKDAPLGRVQLGHGWVNASMPRVVGKLRENQSGHWDDSWEAKRSTSTLPNRSQIWDTVWRFNIHSPGLSFCLDRKSVARFSIPGMWTALKERNLSWHQRRRWHASLSRVRDREPPSRFKVSLFVTW